MDGMERHPAGKYVLFRSLCAGRHFTSTALWSSRSGKMAIVECQSISASVYSYSIFSFFVMGFVAGGYCGRISVISHECPVSHCPPMHN